MVAKVNLFLSSWGGQLLSFQPFSTNFHVPHIFSIPYSVYLLFLFLSTSGAFFTVLIFFSLLEL